MSVVEVAVTDSDDGSSRSLFVLCRRIPASSSKRSSESIHVQLLDPPTLLEADVASSHKPRALACTGVEYVAAVETALTASVAANTEPRFELKWARQKRTLTLMERSEFSMKFCSIQFTVSEDVETWRKLLHQVAATQRETAQLVSEKERRVQQLETLLKQKEALLETALTAKQKTEDQLVRGFCAVLNAKKDEIRRLQDEVDKAQEMQRYEVKPAAKRKVAGVKRTKKPGAKLKKKVEESEDSSRESDDGTSGTEEDEGSEQKRAKNDAIKAYDQLPANLRSSSMQISSAEDLLSSIDDVIKTEEEENEATLRGDGSSTVKLEPMTSPKQQHGSRARKSTIVKTESIPPPKQEPAKPLRPPPPQVDEPMDSEEEDILDMLS